MRAWALLLAALPLLAAAPPPGPLDVFVVTASRYAQPLNRTTAHVTVLTADEIKAAPARSLDDVARFAAGVNVKAGSANIIPPATQTVSMLGVGGAARALVLMDGIPLTDGFGGWVNWIAAPKAIVDRVEILRGGSSSLYGTEAMSGVINILTRNPSERAADLDVSYGSRRTKRLNAYAGDVFLHKFGLSVDYDYYETSGYQWLQPVARGPVDRNADARGWTTQLKAASLEGGAGGPLWFARAIAFGEKRSHGLDHFSSSRDSLEAAGGVRRLTDASGEFRGTAFLARRLLDSSQSAVNAARTTEALFARSYIPSLDAGGSLQWSRPFETLASSVTLGVDVRHVYARNNEDDYTAAGAYQASMSSGGQQTNVGVFAQASLEPAPGLTITPSARLDDWTNHDAVQENAAGSKPLPSKSFAFLSPRLGARWQLTEPFALRAAAYRAFTAPTLQSLYRGARAQGLVQLPNAGLGPEITRLGGEFGWDWAVGSGLARATLFWSEITDAIAAVTIAPGVQQAQNIGSVRSRGVILEAPWRLGDRWSVHPAYTYTNATIRGNVSSPATVGNTLPDIPVHFATLAIGFDDERIATARLAARWLSRRWGNDTHTQPLDEHLVLDFSISRRLTRALEVYFDAENFLDRRYTASQLGGLPILGEPLYVGLGARLRYR
jgi:outer membrane cobalamin receptor